MNATATTKAIPAILSDFLKQEAHTPLRHEFTEGEAFICTQDNHWTLFEASGFESVLTLPLPDATPSIPWAQIYQDITQSPPMASPQGERT